MNMSSNLTTCGSEDPNPGFTYLGTGYPDVILCQVTRADNGTFDDFRKVMEVTSLPARPPISSYAKVIFLRTRVVLRWKHSCLWHRRR